MWKRWARLALVGAGLVMPGRALAQYPPGMVQGHPPAYQIPIPDVPPVPPVPPGVPEPTPVAAAPGVPPGAPPAPGYPPGAPCPPGGNPYADVTEAPGPVLSESGPNAFNDHGPGIPECPSPVWFSYERLFYQFKNDRVNAALVTTSTSPDPINSLGELDQAGTQVLYGNGPVDLGSYGAIQGNRITMGTNFYPVPPFEVSGFWVNNQTDVFSATSDGSVGSQVLARPVQAVNMQSIRIFGSGEDVAFVSGFPGIIAGGIQVNANTNLWGIQTDMVFPLLDNGLLFFTVTGAYRHLDLNEGIQITSSTTSINDLFVIEFAGDQFGFGPGSTTIVRDSFRTRNQFNGGQIGMRTGMDFGALEFLLDGRLGVGGTSQTLQVEGSSTLVTPTARGNNPATLPGGILALPSNSGTFRHSGTSFIGEVGFYGGLTFSSHFRLFAGYNFLYWSNVVRPGEQITNIVDTRQIPTDQDYNPAAASQVPAPRFQTTDFFAHGIHVGLVFGF